MIFNLKKVTIFIGFIFLVQCFKAQISQDSVPLVISLIDDSSSNISKVKNQLLTLSNTRFIGFCDNHKVFLMYVDPQFHGSSTVFLSNLIKTTGLYELTLKEGSVTDIIGFCEFKDSVEHEKNKLQQAK